MRSILLVSVISISSLGLGCASSAAPQPKQAEASKSTPSVSPSAQVHNHSEDSKTARITLEDAKKEFDKGTAVFVDTRDISTYRSNRIKGAIHLPAEAASTRWNELPKDKKIIAYCS